MNTDRKNPNILFIFSDQQRYDCIGRSAAYPVKTANIDQLAKDGMWFSSAYTPMPLCSPARQALLNGRRPEQFGSYWNLDFGVTGVLKPEDYSWPRELQKRGYQTGYIGKWHVNQEFDPTHFGFSDYISINEYRGFRKEKYPDFKTDNNSAHDEKYINFLRGWYGRVDPVKKEDSRTHWMADQTIELIKKYQVEGKPWHIRLDFEEPHLPCCPVKEFADLYDPDNSSSVPIWGSFYDNFKDKPYIQRQQLYSWGVEDFNWENWAPIVARYYAIVTQIDDAIGKVLKAVKEMDLENNTIIIYTADHGDMCGGHRMMDKQYVMYDDIVKVPLIIKWTGFIEPDSVCDEFVYNVLDIQPTILDMLGLPKENFFSGRSLIDLLKGQKINDWRQEIISTYNGMQFGLYTERMIRDRKYKYVWNTTDVDELYDMEYDPNELVNLIHQEEYRELISDFRVRLYKGLIEANDFLAKSFWMGYQLLNNKKI